MSSSWIRREKRIAIYLRDNYRCIYCNKDLKNADNQNITLDHIKPRSQGGSNRHTNLITCCKQCNSTRSNKPIRQFTTKEIVRKIRKQRYKSIRKYINIVKGRK